MEKRIILVTNTVLLEIDETAFDFDNFGSALDGGGAKIIFNDIVMSNGNGEYYDNKEDLDKIKQKFIEALKEMG